MSDEDEKDDLTRIEDLGEFTHQSNPEIDQQLESGPPPVPTVSDENFTAEESLQEDSLQESEFAEPHFEETNLEEAAPEDVSLEEAAPEEASLEEDNVEEPAPEEASLEEDNVEKPNIEEFAETNESLEEQEQSQEIEYGKMVKETFEDVRQFSESLSYGIVTGEGNPPYSVTIKNINSLEDAEDILSLLKEHEVCNEKNENDFIHGIEQGAVIIPHIGEYAAIYIAHKLRRFNVNLQIGLASDVYPTKSYVPDGKGLTGKLNIHQNVSEEVTLDSSDSSEEGNNNESPD